MRYLIDIDVDETKTLDFALIDMRDKNYVRKVKNRLRNFIQLRLEDPDVVGMVFEEKESNYVKFYSAIHRPGYKNLSIISPLLVAGAKKVEGVPSFLGIYELHSLEQDVSNGARVVDVEMNIGEEGMSYRAFMYGQGKEIITSPIPIVVLAKKFRIKLPEK